MLKKIGNNSLKLGCEKNLQKYDVIVIGGGTSGMMAAISASENGAKVLLIEKTVNSVKNY